MTLLVQLVATLSRLAMPASYNIYNAKLMHSAPPIVMLSCKCIVKPKRMRIEYIQDNTHLSFGNF